MSQSEAAPDTDGVETGTFRVPSRADLYENIQTILSGASGVASASVEDNRLPPRIRVESETGELPATVSDLVDNYDGEVRDPSVSDAGALSFCLIFPAPVKKTKDMKLRRHSETSPTTRGTIPKEAMAVAGFEQGEDVEVFARDGEIILRRS